MHAQNSWMKAPRKNSPATPIQFITPVRTGEIRFNSYSQQIIEWETFNPLIRQVHSAFHSANAANLGDKSERENMGEREGWRDTR